MFAFPRSAQWGTDLGEGTRARSYAAQYHLCAIRSTESGRRYLRHISEVSIPLTRVGFDPLEPAPGKTEAEKEWVGVGARCSFCMHCHWVDFCRERKTHETYLPDRSRMFSSRRLSACLPCFFLFQFFLFLFLFLLLFLLVRVGFLLWLFGWCQHDETRGVGGPISYIEGKGQWTKQAREYAPTPRSNH